jgi:glucose/arabinose dehydrogenase
MRTTSMRLVAALVVTSVAVGGVSPLAQAQQPTPPADSTPLEQSEQPMAPPEPAVTPAPPAEPTMAQAQQPVPVMPPPPAPPAATTPPIRSTPDFFQEQMKEQQASAQRKQVLYEAGAVVTNVFLIPGRAITCALGTGLGVVVLAITFGTGYKTAAGAFDEGCGGKWVVNGDDLKPDGGSRAFEWER